VNDELQFYQGVQLQHLLQDVRAVVAQKRLEALFDIELFAFYRSVDSVVAAPTRAAGQAALREGRELLRRLHEAPDKSGGGLLVR
jgi:hypothetical protein